MAHPVIKALQQHFAADLRFVFKHFPLADLNSFAEPASEVGRAVWPVLADARRPLSKSGGARGSSVRGAERSAGRDEERLIYALKHRNFKAKIETDVMGAVRSRVSGTPAFFIDGNRYRGACDFNALAAAVRRYREADAHL
jgi:protein-disulfide isomerase